VKHYYTTAAGLSLCVRHMDASELGFWSGARDLNPGPHGPELRELPASHAKSCGFQFEISDSAATDRQKFELF
jgi:hypothetical protein